MSGFDNETLFCDNLDFRGISPVVGQFTAAGQILIGTGSTPALTVSTITAGSGISIVNGAGSITITATPTAAFTWSVIGASQALAVNKGYICTTGAALSLSLPASSAVGNTIAVALKGSTSWTITQGAGQTIHIGSSSTTVGAGGTLASTATGDTITFVCMVANTTWICTSVVGNITVV